MKGIVNECTPFVKKEMLKEVDRIKRIKRTSELGKNTENRQNCLPDLN
jgi:hypothetical protein